MWLHSSVGRASHQYRRGHGLEYCRSLDFFRLLLSSCLNWKIYCDDHSSLWSTTAVQIYELFHIYFTSTKTYIGYVSTNTQTEKLLTGFTGSILHRLLWNNIIFFTKWMPFACSSLSLKINADYQKIKWSWEHLNRRSLCPHTCLLKSWK